MPVLSTVGNEVRLAVKVVPRASRTEIAGVIGEALRIRLAAPPVDGEANELLIRFLAKSVGLPGSALRLVGGTSGRGKTVAFLGLTEGQIAVKLGIPAPGDRD